MTTRNKFSPEVRERAVRTVEEHRGDYCSEWAATQLDCREDRLHDGERCAARLRQS